MCWWPNPAVLRRKFCQETTVQSTKELIHDDLFIDKHRNRPTDFTRRRKLPFSNVMVLLLQKTVRSIQLHLHDFFKELCSDIQSAKASSWCRARMKLRHTAFIELNERAVLDVVYRKNTDFQVHRWNGHRLIAIDSSLVRLPDNDAAGEEFGWVLKSAEAVRQDLYSTIFLSNFESILIRPAQEELQRKSEPLKNRQQVNHSVSFHAIKSEIIRLLLSNKPTSQVLAEIRLLFLDNPVSTRSHRIIPRKKQKQSGNSYNYQRNVKKSVF